MLGMFEKGRWKRADCKALWSLTLRFSQISVVSRSNSQCEERNERENLIQGHLLVFKQGNKLVHLWLIALFPFTRKKEDEGNITGIPLMCIQFWNRTWKLSASWLPGCLCLQMMIHWWTQSWTWKEHSILQPCSANPLTNRPSSYSESCCLAYFKGQCPGEECDILGHLCNCLIV